MATIGGLAGNCLSTLAVSGLFPPDGQPVHGAGVTMVGGLAGNCLSTLAVSGLFPPDGQPVHGAGVTM
ncbi:hypothetical protein AB0M58_14210, partial [Streptomyces bobili]|uniref:hypothetical protein n=1 Tax=Streptomyces bobili TaxID=67280 RepID=UPI00342D0543